MEYVDNAIDAAEGRRQVDPDFVGTIAIAIDLFEKTVAFTDNCGGMSPDQLVALLDSVGESSKKAVPWANGQFGFGVHAFRGFARFATFASHREGFPAAEITIDREKSESEEVECVELGPKLIAEGETRVVISGFDAQHFKKSQIITALCAEIEQHFDDILRSGMVEVLIHVKGSAPKKLEVVDFDRLPGDSIRESIEVCDEDAKRVGHIGVDVRLLDKSLPNRSVVLTNKGRRIQSVSDLRSFRKYVAQAGRSPNVWNNPFLVGSIEVNDIVSPNLTRDDLKDTRERSFIYATMLEVQLRLEELIREKQQKKKKQAYEELADRVSECLAQVLKKHRIRFEDVLGSGSNGKGYAPGDEVAFGGTEAGGGGPSPDKTASGGLKGEGGSGGPGDDGEKGGPEGSGRASVREDLPGGGAKSGPPKIEFDAYPDEPARVIPIGSVLTVNIAHKDFIQRTKGAQYLDARLSSYVAQVVAGPCIEYFYAKRGKAMTPALVISQVVELSMHLDDALVASGIMEEFVNSADTKTT